MTQCPKCGSTASHLSGGFCPVCGTPVSDRPVVALPQHSTVGIPWESIENLGVFTALVRTIRECLLQPKRFFENVSSSSNTTLAFFYALILGSIGSIISCIWTYALVSIVPLPSSWMDSISEITTPTGASLIFLPLFTLIKILFSTIYFQTLLTLTKTKRQGIKSTFCIVSYAESIAILNIIPVAGTLFSMVWSLYLIAIGFNRVHKMSVTKAVFIILLPLLILAVMGIIALLFLVGAGALLSGLI